MMFTAFSSSSSAMDCDSSSRCSTASPATGDHLGGSYYQPSPAGSYSDLGSPQSQDFTDLSTASASFVPTVTAISTSPDLQWMVQPFSSVAPSNRVHPYSTQPPAYPRAAMKSAATSRAHSKKGRSEQISPEEEEKRRVRRERNKQAAAKCRNRRRELTDTLQAETDELEDEKASIQNDIANLLKEKERLEFILAAHKPICKIPSDLDLTFPTVSLSVSPAHSSCGSPTSSESSCTTNSTTVAAVPSIFTTSSNSIFSTSSTTTTTTAAAAASRLTDLDDAAALEESLDLLSRVEMEVANTARSVPEVDLSSSLYAAQDWEPLYTSSSTTCTTISSVDFEAPLCTPVVTCTPTLTTNGASYTTSFAFTYPEADALFPSCGAAHLRRGSSSNEHSNDSLSSPTLLAL